MTHPHDRDLPRDSDGPPGPETTSTTEDETAAVDVDPPGAQRARSRSDW